MIRHEAAPTASTPENDPSSGSSRGGMVAAVWALFAGIGLLHLGNGLQGSLLGVRSSQEGFSTLVTGVIMAAFYGGFLVGTRVTINLLRNVGHIRVFAALASTASASVLLHAVFVSPSTWVLIRMASGFCVAGLYVTAESWLNDMATNETRGKMLSVYMMVTMGAIASGQFLLNVGNSRSFELFIVASVLVSLSLVPVSLSATGAPPINQVEPMTLRELWHEVPLATTLAFAVGITSSAMIGMGALYATISGFDTGRTSLFMALLLGGAMLFQWPIGAVSDRVPRRVVITSVAAFAALAGGIGIVGGGVLPFVAALLVGGASFPLYSLAIAHAADWIPTTKLASASGMLVLVSGVGAIIGPILAATVMQATGPGGFFATLSAVHAFIAVYAGYRLTQRDSVPVEDLADLMPIPARSTSVATNLLRRRPRVPLKRRKRT